MGLYFGPFSFGVFQGAFWIAFSFAFWVFRAAFVGSGVGWFGIPSGFGFSCLWGSVWECFGGIVDRTPSTHPSVHR